MMKTYDAVIFDLDGTLLNTLGDLADSVNYVLARYGFPTRQVAEIRKFVGNGVARLIELAIPDGRKNPQFADCLADFRAHYAEHMQQKTGPYPGITALLRQLVADGYKTAIVSNKFDAAVKELSRVYFGELIPVAIGESANVAKKPAPDTVRAALAALGVTADRAIYIGDSEVDVATARNAGLPCVGVTWGFRDRAVLEEQGADYIIDDARDLYSILETV